VEVWYTANVQRLRLGQEKKNKEETTRQKYNGLPYSIGWPIKKKEREKKVTTAAKCN